MDNKTQGIVLQNIRYGDSSLITKVFTENFGLQSFMIKGAFNRTSKNRAAFFQNMNIINFVMTSKSENQSLGFLKDVEIAYSYQSIPFEMSKSAITIYMCELLTKTLTGQEQNVALYQFVRKSLMWLDLVDDKYANFPLFFTLEISRFLGFYPKADYVPYAYFDLTEGHFSKQKPYHPYYLDNADSKILADIIGKTIDELSNISLSVTNRRKLLDGIINFMRLHAPILKGLQSHEILKTILS
jgi:DNA repair protein RecO